MSDLAERLKGVIEEKLAIARAAGGSEWLANMPTVYMEGHSAGSIRPAGGGLAVIQGTFRGGVHEFVETHDPAWAIRMHQFALHILAEHVADPECTVRDCLVVEKLADAYGVPVDTEEERRNGDR